LIFSNSFFEVFEIELFNKKKAQINEASFNIIIIIHDFLNAFVCVYESKSHGQRETESDGYKRV